MNNIKLALYWIPTLLFGLTMGAILLIFHPLQWLALRVGYEAHKSTVDAMIWCLNKSLLLVGCRREIINLAGELPKDRPMIIVSNHQSMFDIPAIGQVLRKHHPKYVAKKSLARGIPSVSFNIRHGGSISIDRADREQAIIIISKFCDYLKQNNYAGCIFPEGSRSKGGQLAPFKQGGLAAMIETMPQATIVPVVLQNFWKIGKYKMTPIPFGIQLKCFILAPIEKAGKTTTEIIDTIEPQMKQYLASAS